MNFSNFFIDALSGSDSAQTLSSKKNASPAFMFSDIMKVCEEESSTSLVDKTALGTNQTGSEVFSSSDTVINLTPEELTAITQLLASLIQNSGDQQPTKSVYQIDEANITKQQFVIPESKLVDLLSDLVEKDNFPISSLAVPIQQTDIGKPITFTFKSGANKLTIALNPIKIDENYSSSVINNEYSFVNNLMVREGLLQKLPEETLVEPDTKTLGEEGENETTNSLETGLAKSDSDTLDIPKELFYKTEIIQIINTNPQINTSAEPGKDYNAVSEFNVNSTASQKYVTPETEGNLNSAIQANTKNELQIQEKQILEVNANQKNKKIDLTNLKMIQIFLILRVI